MYRKEAASQLKFEDFYLPFGGKLRSDNRWVILAKQIPWQKIEEDYSANFNGLGCPAKPARVALGSLIIKERLGTTDRETVLQIAENPYLQYFLGFAEYKDEVPFDHSLLTPKISAAVVDGFGLVDRISWEAYNESGDLKTQVEKYRERFGYYPESVHADQIYRSRENRQYCTANGIRLSGMPLGRPKTVTVENAEQLKMEKRRIYQDEIDRIAIEGKFGQGKRRFSLDRIMAKLAVTSETVIMVAFMVMNLEKILAAVLSFLLHIWLICRITRITACLSACRGYLIYDQLASQPPKIHAPAG